MTDLSYLPEDPTAEPAVWARLSDLKPWSDNPNVHLPTQVGALMDLFSIHDFNTAISVHWPSTMIVQGHGRCLALYELQADDPGWEVKGFPGPGWVPVRFRGGTFDEARIRRVIREHTNPDSELQALQ